MRKFLWPSRKSWTLLSENILILLRTNLNVQWQYENPLGRMHSDDKISSTVLDSLGGSQKLNVFSWATVFLINNDQLRFHKNWVMDEPKKLNVLLSGKERRNLYYHLDGWNGLLLFILALATATANLLFQVWQLPLF